MIVLTQLDNDVDVGNGIFLGVSLTRKLSEGVLRD